MKKGIHHCCNSVVKLTCSRQASLQSAPSSHMLIALLKAQMVLAEHTHDPARGSHMPAMPAMLMSAMGFLSLLSIHVAFYSTWLCSHTSLCWMPAWCCSSHHLLPLCSCASSICCDYMSQQVARASGRVGDWLAGGGRGGGGVAVGALRLRW